jgi:hypothetical protein
LIKGDGVINNALYVITTGTTAWARYDDVDFGAGYSHVAFEVMLEQEMSNAVLELRLGSARRRRDRPGQHRLPSPRRITNSSSMRRSSKP